ncbi:MAG: rhodanese-like domain-containing protein [Phycisphaeraceae bacterium]|nr:rhodanese-like domain-containing protein [Phycisphaeraceae bacterium]
MRILVRALAIIGAAGLAGIAYSWTRPVMLRAPEREPAPRGTSTTPHDASPDTPSDNQPAADQTDEHRPGDPGDAPSPPDLGPVVPVDPDSLGTRISLQEARYLHTLIDSGEVVFLDARGHEGDYEAGHIAGALHLTIDMIDNDQGQVMGFSPNYFLVSVMPRGTRYVIYCNGGECDESVNLNIRLFDRGVEVTHIMTDGYPHWKDAGLPVATGPEPGP